MSFTSILGILVNILLRKLLFSNLRKNQTENPFFSVYGVLRKSKLFLLPWLAFHVFLILAAILTTIVVLVKAKPMIYRLFFLVPLGCGLYFIFCWAKVHILMDQKSFSTTCNYFFSGLRLLLSHQENKNKRGHRQKFVCYEVSTNVILCESDSYKVLSKVLKFALSTRLKAHIFFCEKVSIKRRKRPWLS